MSLVVLNRTKAVIRPLLILAMSLSGMPLAQAAGPPGVTLTATPNSGLAQQQNINASGSGYTPNSQVVIHQCAADQVTCSDPLATLQANGSGSFNTTVTVQRSFQTQGEGPTIDCLATSCVLYAYETVSGKDANDTLTFAKSSSSITLEVTKTENRVKAAGLVTPNHAGDQVSVKLFRKKDGSFVKLDTNRPTLDEASTYLTSFPRPNPGTCKIVSKFPGDYDHLASKAADKFNC